MTISSPTRRASVLLWFLSPSLCHGHADWLIWQGAYYGIHRAGKSALWGAKPICRAHGKELHMKNLVETAKFKRISVAGRRLAKTKSGVALIEFAYSLPIHMAIMMSGAELTNYSTVDRKNDE